MWQKMKTYVIAAAIASGGGVTTAAPGIWKDWSFLRLARQQYERQLQERAAQAQQPAPRAPAAPQAAPVAPPAQ